MKTKTVELVASPIAPHFVGDGFRVHNFIPSGFRLDVLGSIPDLDKEAIGKIEEKLRITFLPEKKDAGNVCMANSPEVRDDYKDTFNAKHLLNYRYAVLHSPRYLGKYKDLSKIDVVEFHCPNKQDVFWKLARLGAQLRQLHLSASPSVKKNSGEITEIMKEIAEIEIEERL